MPAAFSIDEFEFIALSRVNPDPTMGIVREVKAGVRGVTFWNTGIRSKPFTLLSVVNVEDIAAGKELLIAYQALKNSFAPVEYVWAGESADPLMLMILDVDVIDEGLYATLLGIGGIDPSPSHAMLRCRWEVEAVEVE